MMDGWISEMTGWGGAQGEGEGRFSVALKKDDVEEFRFQWCSWLVWCSASLSHTLAKHKHTTITIPSPTQSTTPRTLCR